MKKIINKINDIAYALQGRKTYIMSFVAAALALAQAFGWTSLTNEQAIGIETAIFAFIAMFLRAGINKV